MRLPDHVSRGRVWKGCGSFMIELRQRTTPMRHVTWNVILLLSPCHYAARSCFNSMGSGTLNARGRASTISHSVEPCKHLLT